MKTSLLSAVAIGCALALAGCQSAKTVAATDYSTVKADAKSVATAVKAGIQARCSVDPTGSSVTALLDAANGSLTVQDLIVAGCAAFGVVSAYTAETRAPLPPRRSRKGEPVSGTAVVNGKPVQVTGTVAK